MSPRQSLRLPLLSSYPTLSVDGLAWHLRFGHIQIHRILSPHPQGNPILHGQMTAGGGAQEL